MFVVVVVPFYNFVDRGGQENLGHRSKDRGKEGTEVIASDLVLCLRTLLDRKTK